MMKNVNKLENPLIYLIGINTALLVACNSAGAKMIALPWGLAASAVVVPYALSFLFTDVISELYGAAKARMAVRVGFAGLVLSVIFIMIAIKAPPAGFWDGQDAYSKTLGIAPRLLIGGWTSYLISQHLDVWIFHTLKKITKGRHLWLRNNLSTLISQFIDTCIFITISFYGMFPLWPAILGQYLVKITIAVIDTPLCYLVVGFLRNKFDFNERQIKSGDFGVPSEG